MIHYHGTPIGGTKIDAARFLVGRHGLVSFVYQENLAEVLENCQSFCLDNGAFSHWKAGKGEIDFDAYWKWCDDLSYHPCFDFCLIPDKIDGDESENIDRIMKWIRIGGHAKGVPVWHLHESLEHLEWLVNNFEIVALGSSGNYSHPGTKRWWKRINESMRVICDDLGRPKCKLHGLRMLDPDIFTKLPFSSADSTNAAVNQGSLARFGVYIPTTSYQRATVIADRIEKHNSACFYTPQKETDDLFANFGVA
jgi:hypothetical protein